MSRKRLAALGLTTDLKSVPAWKCDAFLAIDSRIEELKELDRKRRELQTKGRRRGR